MGVSLIWGFVSVCVGNGRLSRRRLRGGGLSSMAKERHKNHTIPLHSCDLSCLHRDKNSRGTGHKSSSLGATDLLGMPWKSEAMSLGKSAFSPPSAGTWEPAQSALASQTRNSLVGEPHTGSSVTAKPGNHHHAAGLGPSSTACCVLRAGRKG